MGSSTQMLLYAGLLIALFFTPIPSVAQEDFNQVEKFRLIQSKQNKLATCTFKLKYDYPDIVYTSGGSTVSCKVTKWPKSVAINYKKTFTFLIGNFSADVRIEITKIKNKVTIKTALLSAETTTVENKTSPWDLWCPAEGTIIWGDLNGPLIVNDSLIDPIDADSYKECARRCSEFEQADGNKPCFSWVLNTNTFQQLDLTYGMCRLYGYKDVYRIAAPGVQSGYHKCYPAMQELGIV